MGADFLGKELVCFYLKILPLPKKIQTYRQELCRRIVNGITECYRDLLIADARGSKQQDVEWVAVAWPSHLVFLDLSSARCPISFTSYHAQESRFLCPSRDIPNVINLSTLCCCRLKVMRLSEGPQHSKRLLGKGSMVRYRAFPRHSPGFEPSLLHAVVILHDSSKFLHLLVYTL